MSKVQSYLPYDCSSLSNYLAWAQGIGSALSALGWSKTADSGQVNWSNVTQVPEGIPNLLNGYNLGAWAGGTAYTEPASGSTGGNGVVTSAGLIYICQNPTQYTALTNVILNATSSTLATAVTVSGTSVTYTASVSGATTNSLVGQVFTAAGGSNVANNVPAAICISNTSTTVVLQFTGGAAQSTGTLPTLTSSSANMSVGYSASAIGTWISNALAGMSVITAGFAGNTNANGTFTVLASSDNSSASYVGMAYNSAPTTGSGFTGTLTMNTAPASDIVSANGTTGHWLGYNYETWQSNDSLSGTNPIYMRLVYLSNTSSVPVVFSQIGSGSTSGNGTLTGNNVLNGGTEVMLVGNGAGGAAGGNTTYECDFVQYEGSFGFFLWRNAYSAAPGDFAPAFLAIDRAKDNFGNDLDTYSLVLMGGGDGNVGSQVLFKSTAGNGGTMPFWSDAWPAIYLPQSTVSNGLFAAIPVFPIVGYVGNPALTALAFTQLDIANGTVINTVIYGTEHTYLIGYVPLSVTSNSGLLKAVGLRWD